MKNLTFLLLALLINLSQKALGEDSQLSMLRLEIKRSVKKIDSERMKKLMIKHYKQLRIIDENGRWATEKLELRSDYLLPRLEELSGQKIDEFIDEIFTLSKRNNYLNEFVESTKGKTYNYLRKKFIREGHVVMPEVISYALVLDRLTVVFREDWTLLNDYKLLMNKIRKETNLKKFLGVASRVKLISVEKPINRMILSHENNFVNENFFKFLLPINIMEAAAYESTMKNFNNAKAGYVLARKYPESNIFPARFSNDNTGILIGVPRPLLWADLYSVWNLAFVSHFKYWPFMLVKLLIPSVANYEKEPRGYMYNRVIALYVHMHYILLGRMDGGSNRVNIMNWYSEKLTKEFGDSNYRSSQNYLKEF
jgi:hypothetical protein